MGVVALDGVGVGILRACFWCKLGAFRCGQGAKWCVVVLGECTKSVRFVRPNFCYLMERYDPPLELIGRKKCLSGLEWLQDVPAT